MLIPETYSEPERYRDYRNRTMTKHIERLKHHLQGINECSLKKEDRIKLKKQMADLLNEEIMKHK